MEALQQFETKYALNIEDVIMELSEEQISSVFDDTPKQEMLKMILQQRFSITSNNQSVRQSIRAFKKQSAGSIKDLSNGNLRRKSLSYSKQELLNFIDLELIFKSLLSLCRIES